MIKKRKRIRRRDVPPLSRTDKVIYIALFYLTVVGSWCIMIPLVNFIREKIAYQDAAVIAFRVRLAYLWLAPFLLHMSLGCAFPLAILYMERKPIFGNKAIAYGEYPWKSDLFPLFGSQRRHVELPKHAKLMRRIYRFLWISGLILTVITIVFCLCRRSCLKNNWTITVYDTFNQQTDVRTIPEDYTSLTIQAKSSVVTKSGGIIRYYELILFTPDGTEYKFQNNDFRGNHIEALKTMLQIKGFFSTADITIKGTEKLNSIIDYYDLDVEESALLLDLFRTPQ